MDEVVTRTKWGAALGLAATLILLTGIDASQKHLMPTAEASSLMTAPTAPTTKRATETPSRGKRNQTSSPTPLVKQEPVAITLMDDTIRPEECTRLFYTGTGKQRVNYLKRVPCENNERMLLPVALKDLAPLKSTRGGDLISRLLSSLAGERCDPTKSGCKSKPHHGWDIRAKEGTPIYSPFSGEILDVGVAGDCGNRIVVDFAPGDGALTGTFCHLSEWRDGIRPGLTVKRGELLGYSGATGNATRFERGSLRSFPHVHLQFKMKRLPKGCKIVPDANTVDPFCFAWDFKFMPPGSEAPGESSSFDLTSLLQ